MANRGNAIKSAEVTSTGTLVATGAVLLSIWLESSATAGQLILKDGGSGGTTLITLDTPAVAGNASIPIPDPGIEFETDIHATLTNVAGCTVFYR